MHLITFAMPVYLLTKMNHFRMESLIRVFSVRGSTALASQKEIML